MVTQGLGRYRTDVNRGLGWVHAFLAQDCVSMKPTHVTHNTILDADTKQEKQIIRQLHLEELEKAVRGGEFVEVQWTAAVSLALFYLKETL